MGTTGRLQWSGGLEEVVCATDLLQGNYLPEACKGCVVVHRSHALIIGTCPVDADEAPFQWDPLTKVFTVANAERHTCFTYLTFCGAEVLDQHDAPFLAGTTRTQSGEVQPVTTFVIVAEPRTALRLGRVHSRAVDFYALELERLIEPPNPRNDLWFTDHVSHGSYVLPDFGFPLPSEAGPYLCTQGVGGHLTHFFPESFHAIDFRCSPRTPVLSVGDGVVKEVLESNHCSGIHAANLAAWNSVSVLLNCGLVVEYLHTFAGSSRVRPGDVVHRGQVLCETGDVGFAPEPHLHIELHDAADAEGPSVPLHFGGKSAFVPVAGRWYAAEGEVPPPSGSSSSATGDHEVSSASRGASPGASGTAPPPPRATVCCRKPPGRRRASRFGCMALKQKASKENVVPSDTIHAGMANGSCRC